LTAYLWHWILSTGRADGHAAGRRDDVHQRDVDATKREIQFTRKKGVLREFGFLQHAFFCSLVHDPGWHHFEAQLRDAFAVDGSGDACPQLPAIARRRLASGRTIRSS
jgi:hypothetical protein